MQDTFITAFLGAGGAVLQIAFVLVGAGFLVRRGHFPGAAIKVLSDAVVKVFLPCLVFTNITGTLRPDELSWWWAMPLSAIAMAALGLGLSALALRRELKEPGGPSLLPLAALQNAGYLVLPLGRLILPEEHFDLFALGCFLFILAHNPILWSVGLRLTSGRPPSGWKGLITPPLVANLIALACVFTGLRDHLPKPFTGAVGLVGEATVPVATFVLGASLGQLSWKIRKYLGVAVRVLFLKLVAIPAIVVAVLQATPLRETAPVIALLLVLQAAANPATTIVLQIQTYGGDLERAGTVLLLSYFASLATIPFWVAFWQALG